MGGDADQAIQTVILLREEQRRFPARGTQARSDMQSPYRFQLPLADRRMMLPRPLASEEAGLLRVEGDEENTGEDQGHTQQSVA